MIVPSPEEQAQLIGRKHKCVLSPIAVPGGHRSVQSHHLQSSVATLCPRDRPFLLTGNVVRIDHCPPHRDGVSQQ